jgi:hypothetical protein
MNMLAQTFADRGAIHDHTKLEHLDLFHRDLVNGVKDDLNGKWRNLHLGTERHHLFNEKKYIPKDVDLIDLLESICDIIATVSARGGNMSKIDFSSELVLKCCENTVKKIKGMVDVVG